MSKTLKPVIFCDFDGTITEKDNIIAIIKHFSPAGWDVIVEQIIDRTITIREGVAALFALLPSKDQPNIIQYAIDNATIRAGFADFLIYCREQQIEFLVTSGGIDFFVHPLLEPFQLPRDHIFCNSCSFEGERLEIMWPHPCDDQCPNQGCGMCKTTIARSYPADDYLKIVIGDSVTDFEAAKLADVIFARSHLVDKCVELNLPYSPYDTFYDIIEVLTTLEHGGWKRDD